MAAAVNVWVAVSARYGVSIHSAVDPSLRAEASIGVADSIDVAESIATGASAGEPLSPQPSESERRASTAQRRFDMAGEGNPRAEPAPTRRSRREEARR